MGALTNEEGEVLQGDREEARTYTRRCERLTTYSRLWNDSRIGRARRATVPGTQRRKQEWVSTT